MMHTSIHSHSRTRTTNFLDKLPSLPLSLQLNYNCLELLEAKYPFFLELD